MDNSLSNAYLAASGLDHDISKLGELGAKIALNAFEASLSQISRLASGIVITPELQKSMNALIATIGSATSENVIPEITTTIKEFLRAIPVPSDLSSDDFVIMSQESIKEYEIPETIAIPIGHNRVKIKFDTLIAIISLILAAFSVLKPSAPEQEQIALQKNEVQVLSQILENAEAIDPKISEELNTLKESVHELNSRAASIEQYLEENSQSEKNDTQNK